VLLDRDVALQEFFSAMDLLGQKLGPMVFSFHFSTEAYFGTGTNFWTGWCHF
jgi:hypothetical protein